SRFKRGIYLSAVRAYLFNLVLAKRIEQGNWNHIVDGELCILDGSNSVFVHDNTDDSIQKRCAQFDIHPSGPLCGRGTSLSIAQAADIEADALSEHVELMQGLEKAGVTLARRALRALPNQLQWQWLDHKTLQLSFRLRRGVYATSLLAELAQISQAG
ncbi:MAG: tRNA pseudouridine(13) synthase TruD, partial [Pseudomonadota bacterium]